VCRIAGLVAGDDAQPQPLSTLLTEPPHSLERQIANPTMQRPGAVNADGTGIAWWTEDAPEPLRYVTDKPLWGDPNLPLLAPRIFSGTQLALVRAATRGIPQGNAYVAPFLAGTMACVHNGWIGLFRERTARLLLNGLPDHLFARYHGASDSLVTFLVTLAELEQAGDGDLAAALRAAVLRIAAACRPVNASATLTVAIGDGERIAAVRAAVDHDPGTLWVLDRGARWPQAAVLASEPLDDDPFWRELGPGSIVELGRAGAKITVDPELEDLAQPRPGRLR
jgi:gamma-glutamyl hercynylcysteine S-oxide hydrolase